MSFSFKPRTWRVILNNNSTKLLCSANGNTKKMSGTWLIPYKSREALPVTKTTTGTQFFMSTVVNETGIYQCQITDGKKEIETSTTVQVLSSK